MAKQKKKRNKSYQGIDAKLRRPTVVHVEAVNRNRVSQWWFDNKKVARPVLIAIVVAVILIWLVFELLRVIF